MLNFSFNTVRFQSFFFKIKIEVSPKRLFLNCVHFILFDIIFINFSELFTYTLSQRKRRQRDNVCKDIVAHDNIFKFKNKQNFRARQTIRKIFRKKKLLKKFDTIFFKKRQKKNEIKIFQAITHWTVDEKTNIKGKQGLKFLNKKNKKSKCNPLTEYMMHGNKQQIKV